MFDKGHSYHDTICYKKHMRTPKLSAMLCSAPTWHQTFQPALPSHPITSPIASVHATLHLLLSTIPSVCLDCIYDFTNTYHTYIYKGVRGIDHISFLCICILSNLCKSDICLAQFDIHNHDCSNVSKTFCYATTPTLPNTYMFCNNPNINDLITQHLPTIFITTTVTPEECLKLCENAQTTFTLHPNF